MITSLQVSVLNWDSSTIDFILVWKSSWSEKENLSDAKTIADIPLMSVGMNAILELTNGWLAIHML